MRRMDLPTAHHRHGWTLHPFSFHRMLPVTYTSRTISKLPSVQTDPTDSLNFPPQSRSHLPSAAVASSFCTIITNKRAFSGQRNAVSVIPWCLFFNPPGLSRRVDIHANTESNTEFREKGKTRTKISCSKLETWGSFLTIG